MKQEDILRLKSELTDKELAVFNSEMEKYKKSSGLAYVLLIFFGTLGIHKFYVGKIVMAFIYLVLGLIAWLSLIAGTIDTVMTFGEQVGSGLVLFIILISVLGILLIIDLFTLSRQIRKSYERKEKKVLLKLKGLQDSG